MDSLLGRLVARGRTGKAVCGAENEEQLKALLEQCCCHGVIDSRVQYASLNCEL